MPLILNQYRTGSSYKDRVGETYHFPKRYLKCFADLPVSFVYFEPRRGGNQTYFGSGLVVAVNEDTEESDHFYADLAGYRSFSQLLGFYDGPNEGTWESSRNMRNSVRRVTSDLFSALIAEGGLTAIDVQSGQFSMSSDHVDRLHRQLDRIGLNLVGADAFTLTKVRRIYEAYERPSSVTNAVKQIRGSTCQICGCKGFLKRDGRPYCEVHHLFHLAKDPPPGCLHPEFIVVLCATCHRRMHYADVGTPARTALGWRVTVDGAEFHFTTQSPL